MEFLLVFIGLMIAVYIAIIVAGSIAFIAASMAFIVGVIWASVEVIRFFGATLGMLI